MALPELARSYLDFQAALTTTVVQAVAALWESVDPDRPTSSWVEQRTGERLFVAVSSAQQAIAERAPEFVSAAVKAQGVEPDPVAEVVPASFVGIASDGRELESLLLQPLIEMEVELARGIERAQAAASARASLETIASTQVVDAGRTASSTAIAAEPQVSGWVRLLTPPSCARCIILAGRVYDWSADFERHPRCDCGQCPAIEDRAGDVRTDPQAYFESIDRAEQDRIFTKAGAEAIRLGADMNAIVNVRRKAAGLSSPGSRRGGTVMPAEIMAAAGGDRDEAVRLLRRHGFLK